MHLNIIEGKMLLTEIRQRALLVFKRVRLAADKLRRRGNANKFITEGEGFIWAVFLGQ